MSAPRRTVMLAGAAALAATEPLAAAITAMAPNAVRAAGTEAHPDAAFMRLCDEYLRAVDRHNADGGHIEANVDPLWREVQAIGDALDGMAPSTVEGILAEARVAAHLAKLPDGREDFSPSYTGDWPQRVIEHLLQVLGDKA